MIKLSKETKELIQYFENEFNINSVFNINELDKWFVDYEPSFILLNDLMNYNQSDDILWNRDYPDINLTNNNLFYNDESEDLSKTYESDDYVRNPKSLKDVVDYLCENYDMDIHQFFFKKPNYVDIVEVKEVPIFWSDGFGTLIPAINKNLIIMDEVMKDFGYVRVKTTHQRDLKHRDWHIVVYNPEKQTNIKTKISHYDWIHFSPDFNYDSIMDNGIRLSNGNSVYTYPQPRIYIYINESGEMLNVFRKMKASHTQKIRKTRPSFDGTYNAYYLKHSKMDDYEFFYDPNIRDAVFVTKPISIDAVEKIEEVKFV